MVWDLVWKIVFFNEAIPSLPSIFRFDVEKMLFKTDFWRVRAIKLYERETILDNPTFKK